MMHAADQPLPASAGVCKTERACCCQFCLVLSKAASSSQDTGAAYSSLLRTELLGEPPSGSAPGRSSSAVDSAVLRSSGTARCAFLHHKVACMHHCLARRSFWRLCCFGRTSCLCQAVTLRSGAAESCSVQSPLHV